ncbi:MAG: hypothetical protein AAFY91_15925, partial [Bacteroidota bacterium]
MNRRLHHLCTLGILLSFAACANYKPHISEPAGPGGSEIPAGELEYQLVFLSDLYADQERGLTTLSSAAALTQESAVNGRLALLGDVVGPNGMKKKDD